MQCYRTIALQTKINAKLYRVGGLPTTPDKVRIFQPKNIDIFLISPWIHLLWVLTRSALFFVENY